MRLGEVISKTWDDKGYERRQRVDAIVSCPRCGKDVALIAETEEWVRMRDGRWRHISYDACPTGECCGRMLVFDGLQGKALSFGP